MRWTIKQTFGIALWLFVVTTCTSYLGWVQGREGQPAEDVLVNPCLFVLLWFAGAALYRFYLWAQGRQRKP